MICEKYKPKTTSEIVGNKQNISSIIKWCIEWNSLMDTQASDSLRKITNKALLLSGKTGIGKTLAIELITKSLNYSVIYLAGDENRGKEVMEKKIRPLTLLKKGLDGRENILVFDDLDCNDYGFISSLTNLIKDTHIPIIGICNNLYDISLKTIKNYCTCIQFQKPALDEIYRYIINITNNESLQIDDQKLLNMIKSCYDIRHILNQIDFYRNNISSNQSLTSTELTIFEITKNMMSSNFTLEEKYDAYFFEPEIMPLMIHENYVDNNYNTRSQQISDMELFDARVHKEMQWELMPYTACCGINATYQVNKSTFPTFTKYLGNISHHNSIKNQLNSLSIKLKIYTSIRLDYLSYIAIILFSPLTQKDTVEKENIQNFIYRVKSMKLENDEIKNLFNTFSITEYESFKYESIPTKVKSSITREFNKISFQPSSSCSSLEKIETEIKQKTKKGSTTKPKAKEAKEPKKEKTISQKIYLEVPFSKKDEVKLLGGKWDAPLKKWFILDNNKNMEEILSKFKKIDI
jgi:replication factor C subunit 1